MTAIGQTLAINATALLAVIILLWAYSVKIRDVSFIDAFWAFGMVLRHAGARMAKIRVMKKSCAV